MKTDNNTTTTVEEYIANQSIQAQKILSELRKIVREAAPDSLEVISYGMPAYKFHGMLVYYAAYKNHYSIYPMSKAIEVFKDKLTEYKISKGTIQFQIDKPIPKKLITDIVKFRIKDNIQKEMEKEKKK